MFRRTKEFFGRITRRVVARDTSHRNGRQRHQLIQNMFEDCVIRTPNEDGIVNEHMQSKVGEVKHEPRQIESGSSVFDGEQRYHSNKPYETPLKPQKDLKFDSVTSVQRNRKDVKITSNKNSSFEASVTEKIITPKAAERQLEAKEESKRLPLSPECFVHKLSSLTNSAESSKSLEMKHLGMEHLGMATPPEEM